MDSNQTIQLKPVYPHPHISIYNAPIISATMPSFSITSGLNVVGTNGTKTGATSDINPLTTTIQSTVGVTSTHPQLVPVSANNLCLNGIQIQQVQVPQQFSQNQLTAHNGLNINGQPAQLLQIQITTPSSGNTGSSIGMNGVTSNNTQITSKSCMVSDTNSNLSNVSIGSTSSEQTNQCDFNSSGPRKSNPETNNVDYVNLTRASCPSSSNSNSNDTNSANGAIDMQLDLTGNSNNFSNFRSSSNVKGFKCQVCNRNFTQKGNLKTHLMTHSGERPYECRVCGKNFTQKGNLDTHVKIHTETKDHKCQYCDRGFTQRGNLKTHIRSIHTKEKPYACTHCGKAFSQKGNMLTHYKTHDKESRFPCHVCGKTFSQKVSSKVEIIQL